MTLLPAEGIHLRDEYTSLGAWLFAELRAEFGSSAMVRQDGKREKDPEGRAYIYSISPLADTQLMGGGVGLAKFSCTVNVIDKADSSWALGPDAQRIQARLDGRKNVRLEDDYVLLSCVRESPFAPPPVVFKGVEYRRLGGIYRVQIQ